MKEDKVHPSLDQNPLVMFLIMAVILAVSLVWGVNNISSASHYAELTGGPSTAGTVSRAYMDRQGSGMKGINHRMVEVSYVVEGKTYWTEGRKPAMFAPDTSVSDEVNVFYQEDTPQVAVISGWQQNPVLGYLAIGGGFLISVILTRVNILTLKRRRGSGRSLWLR